jgi:hypothetical protein
VFGEGRHDLWPPPLPPKGRGGHLLSIGIDTMATDTSSSTIVKPDRLRPMIESQAFLLPFREPVPPLNSHRSP